MSDVFEERSGPIPGQRSRELMALLRAHESRNVTAYGEGFPVFWETAEDSTVTDVDGNRFIDLTAAFGVANAGHSNPYVVSAVADQAGRLMHGMGDVHPTETRARLLETLARILPGNCSKAFLATTGSEAIEAALKTAMLATGKTRFAAYHGAYHGLSFGALAVGGMARFREPFSGALGAAPLLLDFPSENAAAAASQAHAALAAHDDIAALVFEPIQGRAGCRVPPAGYFAAIAAACKDLGILLVADEIYTGFGRTGAWFSVEHEGIVPDIICVGKALGSGFPIAACAGRPDVMDAWPLASGEALHTSTFLGNPMGCAAALATIHEHERLALAARARLLGLGVASRLAELRNLPAVTAVRGRGLFWGVELRDEAHARAACIGALAAGVIVLQSGCEGNVLTISPPLTIGERQLYRAIDVLEASIRTIDPVGAA